MKNKKLFITFLFLSTKGNIMAQQQMYICRAGQADAYEVNRTTQLDIATDSFRIRQQPAYAIEEIDSIVFRRPALPVRELGWWGNLTDGQSLYKAQLREEIIGIDPFDYDVLFIITAQAGICQSVRCELHFSEQWMCYMFWKFEAEGFDSTGDPYIYVKETATGPRRFEVWVTNHPVLPDGSIWSQDSTMLWSDCSKLLAGRPMEDVQVIVEAWVHQPPKQEENPNYPYY